MKKEGRNNQNVGVFKTYFSNAYFELKEDNKLGTKQVGYLVEELDKAYN